jgi:hypothetical protein
MLHEGPPRRGRPSAQDAAEDSWRDQMACIVLASPRIGSHDHLSRERKNAPNRSLAARFGAVENQATGVSGDVVTTELSGLTSVAFPGAQVITTSSPG